VRLSESMSHETRVSDSLVTDDIGIAHLKACSQNSADMDVSLFDRKNQIDEICRAFEVAHYEAELPTIQDFLDRAPLEDRKETLIELIAIDMELRLQRSDDVRASQYLTQWPELAEEIELLRKEVARQMLSSPDGTIPLSSSSPTDASPFQTVPAGTVGTTGTAGDATDIERRLGDFRIVREIGRDGMGRIDEAVQESPQRRVTLKVLPQIALLRDQMPRN
jgi:hypothetical protein